MQSKAVDPPCRKLLPGFLLKRTMWLIGIERGP